DSTIDSSSRTHITRKLRNKPGMSPPPTPLDLTALVPQAGLISSLPITSGPFFDPHTLSVDELPSPFPLPLTAIVTPTAPQAGGGGNTAGRRRPKNNAGGLQQQGAKILAALVPYKDAEIEGDLHEIRTANKRRRATAVAMGKMGVV
ncbi:hypothetical protein C0991_009723, partial [Blastosporella zonata]